MTQINENLKLCDAKVFFPRSRHVFKRYGIQDQEAETITLRKACEIYNIDLDEFIAEISEDADAYLNYMRSRDSRIPRQ